MLHGFIGLMWPSGVDTCSPRSCITLLVRNLRTSSGSEVQVVQKEAQGCKKEEEEEEQAVEIHRNIMCDGCETKQPLIGKRYKCTTCADYDLCQICHAKRDSIHPGHEFEKIPGVLERPQAGVWCFRQVFE